MVSMRRPSSLLRVSLNDGFSGFVGGWPAVVLRCFVPPVAGETGAKNQNNQPSAVVCCLPVIFRLPDPVVHVLLQS